MSLSRLLLYAVVLIVGWHLVGKIGETASARDVSPHHDVVMFTAPWCGYCDRARAYLEREGVDFLEIDIESSDSAFERFEEFGGRGVPLTFIGEERMSGFSAQMYRQALDQR